VMNNGGFWLELLVRSAVLLLAGEALRRFSRAQSAAFRHRLLLWVLTLITVLPLLAALFPSVPLPLGLWHSIREPKAVVTAYEVSSTIVPTATNPARNRLAILWLTGAALASLPLLAGALSARRLVQQATPFPASGLRHPLSRIPTNLARRAEVLVSGDLLVPLTCGFWRPKILLPAAATEWPSTQVEAVLLHEFAHVQRRDVGAQVMAHLVAALWWFQPLVWVVRHHLRAESELACDAEALRAGWRPSAYATELLAVARALGGNPRCSSLGISMAQPSDLERRIRAILGPTTASLSRVDAYSVGLILTLATFTASAVTVGAPQSFGERGGSTMKRTILSGLLSAAGLSAATISGTVHDPTGAPVSEAKVLVYNPDTGARQEATTDPNGRFDLADDPAGQYIVSVEKPGFASIFREFDLKAGSQVDRQFTMTNEGTQAGSEEIINDEQGERKPIRVGGMVAENNLRVKVQPVYPASAKADHIQGTVDLEATISKDGVPLEIRVLHSPSDDLSEASLEAVRQWRYRPTLLNGQPVEIVTDVIVNYTLSQ
jgi:TonB family protein